MSSLRKPFVVTFTLVAGAVGCHASNDASSSNATTDSGVDSTAEVSDATDEIASETSDAGTDAFDPDAPDCPGVRPILGDHCMAPKDWNCLYADPCPQAPSPGGVDDFSCIEHQWATVGDAYALECPTPAPEAGTPCLCSAHFPSGCILQVCPDLVPQVFDVCDDALKQWRIQDIPCNPPPAGSDADADVDEGDAGD
jgi:hypothetical protein